MPEIKIKKLRPNAKLPFKATEGAACFDLFTAETVNLRPTPATERQTLVGTGIAMEIPKGHHLEVYLRSGVGLTSKVRLANGTGIIDSDYQGEICLILDNVGNLPVHIEEGERIAQCLLVKDIPIIFKEVKEFGQETKRGTKGMGSTGTNTEILEEQEEKGEVRKENGK